MDGCSVENDGTFRGRFVRAFRGDQIRHSRSFERSHTVRLSDIECSGQIDIDPGRFVVRALVERDFEFGLGRFDGSMQREHDCIALVGSSLEFRLGTRHLGSRSGQSGVVSEDEAHVFS